MCISTDNTNCLDPLPGLEEVRVIVPVMLSATDLVLAICSGVANSEWATNDDSYIDYNAKIALGLVALSPLMLFMILIEQAWCCCFSQYVLNFFRILAVAFIDFIFGVTYRYMYIGFNSDCGGVTFAKNMLKTDCIMFSIIGIPCLLWYNYVALQILICCKNRFDRTCDSCPTCGDGYGGGGTVQGSSGHYEIRNEYSSYGTYTGTSRTWRN